MSFEVQKTLENICSKSDWKRKKLSQPKKGNEKS